MKLQGTHIFVLLAVGLLVGCGSSNAPTAPPAPTEAPPTQEEEVTIPTTQEVAEETATLTPDGLLEFNDKPGGLVGQTYRMTLYLEQSPADNLADFTIMKDGNNPDNTIIMCTMSEAEVSTLDADEAQAGNSPEYELDVTFSGFNDAMTPPFYEAECKLI